MTDLTRMTPRQRSHYTYLMDVMSRLEWDFHNAIHRRGRIPSDWAEIAQTTPRQTKQKVTFEVEADVLKFFRAMGKGHGPRMNDVLRAFMHARLAGVVEGADSLAIYREGARVNAGPRPEFGDISRMLGEEPEAEPQAPGYRASLDRAMELMDKARAMQAVIAAK
ncbi:BrnA antitoxin family protein, partial [Pseudorhodobacter sp.]|uniref:BrnA antitoxin family protein n=1 Tax=Pseudorhodobacter sp. TaxID=1934400 RepID=UPI0026472BBA